MVLNGTESDVDCGGTDCKKCMVNQICRAGSDCDTGVCTSGRCAPPSCTDGVKNQGESDIDCGGTTSCPRCADFKYCTAPSDCMTNMCTNNYCGSMGCMGFGVSATSGGYVGCQRSLPIAMLPCEDIRTTGTRSSVTDDSYTTVTLPFSFTFYGVPRTSVLLSASGAISFNTTNPYITNSCLPATSPSSTMPMLAVYWEHLHVTGGGVYTQMFGTAPNRRYVIQWYGTHYGGGATYLDVRAVLKEGRGDMDVCYVNTTSGSVSYDLGITSTSGIMSGTGTFLQYSCNMANVPAGLLLSYTAP